MAELYVITDTRGVDQFVIKAGETNSDTDLKLPGKGAVVWGENLDENAYRLMENFAVEEKGGSPGNPQDDTDLGTDNGVNNPLEGQNWWNITQKKLYVFDGTNWQKIGTSTGSVAPSPASEGDLWFDDVAQQLKVYDGVSFVSTALQYLRLDGNSAMLGNLNMNGQVINFVADNPVAGTDAANKNYVDALEAGLGGGLLDALYVNVTGDSMNANADLTFSGGGEVLGLPATPSVGSAAASKTYVDSEISTLTIIVNDVAGFDPGDIKASAAFTLPTGFLLCNGAAVSRVTFAALFAAISTNYGIGDGATTFNVPDLEGKFPLGVGGGFGFGDQGGEQEHQLTIAEMPSHSHGYRFPSSPFPHDTHVHNRLTVPSPPPIGQTDSAGNDQPHENMPPYTAIRYYIKT